MFFFWGGGVGFLVELKVLLLWTKMTERNAFGFKRNKRLYRKMNEVDI